MFISAFLAAKVHAIESDAKTPWVIVVDDTVVEVAAGRTAARELGIKGKISKYDASLIEFDEEAPTTIVRDADGVVTTYDAESHVAVTEAPTTQAAPKPKLDVLRVSSIERPTKKVWVIADEMLKADANVKRKDIIARCVNEGIAFYTARTQYQQYFETLREQRTRENAMTNA